MLLLFVVHTRVILLISSLIFSKIQQSKVLENYAITMPQCITRTASHLKHIQLFCFKSAHIAMMLACKTSYKYSLKNG